VLGESKVKEKVAKKYIREEEEEGKSGKLKKTLLRLLIFTSENFDIILEERELKGVRTIAEGVVMTPAPVTESSREGGSCKADSVKTGVGREEESVLNEVAVVRLHSWNSLRLHLILIHR